MNVSNRTASDAPATWPDTEREWLQLEDNHGPLKIPMTDMGTVEIPFDDEI